MVVILLSPFGAMFKRTECSFSGHSLPGKTPSAGRLINAGNSQGYSHIIQHGSYVAKIKQYLRVLQLHICM